MTEALKRSSILLERQRLSVKENQLWLGHALDALAQEARRDTLEELDRRYKAKGYATSAIINGYMAELVDNSQHKPAGQRQRTGEQAKGKA